MTREQMSGILYSDAMRRAGTVNGERFIIDHWPFAESDHKYAAYLAENYGGHFYFDTIDEFLKGFIVNNKPIGNQLELIESFKIVSY